MRLTTHLCRVITDLLNEYRIVVWFDGEQGFGAFVGAFQAPQCRVISTVPSALRARRDAEMVYRRMDESEQTSEANATLLIYAPRPRVPGEERIKDPFEGFAATGVVFGEDESERLQSLARTAMPELIEQIDGLFLSGRPTFELLDNLKQTSSYPLVEQALDTQAVADAAVALLASNDALAAIDRVAGADGELLKMLESELGFKPSAKPQHAKSLRDPLARYLLLSELAFDLESGWPESLANVPRADFKYRDRIFAICDRLRTADDTRQNYVELAERIEQDLKLSDYFAGATQLGVRDTFAFEERRYLNMLTEAVSAGDLPAARSILDGRRKSVWRHQPERAQVWQLTERCLNLLDAAARLDLRATTVAGLIASYTAQDGWSDLDRQQRLMEQSCADCTDIQEVMAVVELARRRYREGIDLLQERFLKGVQAEGWPPTGILRQTQVFDRLIGPALERREKLAYILADALRFEMGQALAEQLAELGEVVLQPAAVALPAVTTVGMAALLPGADGALTLQLVGDAYVSHIGDRPVKDSAARMVFLSERYGDRFSHVTLDDWLDFTDKKQAALANKTDLLVLKVPDIDELGEHIGLRQARKHMSGLLGDLKTAAVQLARLGFQSVVIAADHGHVLLPDVLPGDTVQAPEGQWGLTRRRVRLGTQLKERPATLVFKPEFLGIRTAAPDYCVATGFNVYATDANYFHEGLSLQECIVPILELRPKGKPETSSRHQEVQIRYGRDRFTSQVIGAKVHYGSLLDEPLKIRLEAYDVIDPKGPPVGEAADCAAREENTHEVTLTPNVETEVPVLINPDFRGAAVELRAMSSDRMLVWARLRLKNGVLD